MKIPLYFLIQEFLMLFPSKRWVILLGEIKILKFPLEIFYLDICNMQFIVEGFPWARSHLQSPRAIHSLHLWFVMKHYMELWHIRLNLCWSSPFCSGITKYESKELTISYFNFHSDTRTTKHKLKQQQFYIVMVPQDL